MNDRHLPALIHYDAACHAIAQAVRIDDVLQMRDQMEVMRAYARISENKELEAQALEIRLRAERRLGQLMIAHKETVGFNPGHRFPAGGSGAEPPGQFAGGSGAEPVETAPTLKDMGVSKKLSSRAQKLAAVPDAEFEEHIEGHRERVAASHAKTVHDLEQSGERRRRKKPAKSPEDEADIADLRTALDDLRERFTEQGRNLADALSENDSMGRVLEADDKVTSAMAEAKRFREQVRVLTERVNGLLGEKAEAVSAANRWKKKYEQLVKETGRNA